MLSSYLKLDSSDALVGVGVNTKEEVTVGRMDA